MSAFTQPSLFDQSPRSALDASADWFAALLFGEIGVILCILAVALLGALMLTGRLPLQRGARVMLGCFVLIGAPLIAAELLDVAENTADIPQRPAKAMPTMPRGDLPRADNDPYSGA